MSYMFYNVDINNPNSSTNQTNYNNLLKEWSSLSNLKTSVTFHAGSSNYSGTAATNARNTLIQKGWTITDGGAKE